MTFPPAEVTREFVSPGRFGLAPGPVGFQYNPGLALRFECPATNLGGCAVASRADVGVRPWRQTL